MKNYLFTPTTNEGFKKVPVLWLGSERAHQIKNNKDIRDSVGKLKLPLISVNRESIAKDPGFKGSFQAHLFEDGDYKGGAITRVRRVQQEKTRNFANADFARGVRDVKTQVREITKKWFMSFSLPRFRLMSQ